MSDLKAPAGPYELTPAGIWATAPWGERVLIAKIPRHHAGDGIDPEAIGHLFKAAPDLKEATSLLAGALEVLVAEGGFEDRRVCVEGRNWMTFSQILDIADAALGKAKGAA